MYKPTALAIAALAAAPLAAQDDGVVVPADDDSYNMVIVYGEDACPQSTPEQIVVCARKAESERYRIPKSLRYSDDPANEAWAERVEKLEMAGAFGTMSCTPAGGGGFTGCTQKMIEDAYKAKAEGTDVRFGQLVEEARAERLSTIDADAAAEQERVEMIEREYMQRLERERASDDGAMADEPLPEPEAQVVAGDE